MIPLRLISFLNISFTSRMILMNVSKGAGVAIVKIHSIVAIGVYIALDSSVLFKAPKTCVHNGENLQSINYKKAKTIACGETILSH